jgi:hypothetical protein
MNAMIRRSAWIVVAAAAGWGLTPMPPAAAEPGCPIGQHEDTTTPGFQCVPGWCPSGTLLDGVTGACVAPPGVPPPPLS